MAKVVNRRRAIERGGIRLDRQLVVFLVHQRHFHNSIIKKVGDHGFSDNKESGPFLVHQGPLTKFFFLKRGVKEALGYWTTRHQAGQAISGCSGWTKVDRLLISTHFWWSGQMDKA